MTLRQHCSFWGVALFLLCATSCSEQRPIQTSNLDIGASTTDSLDWSLDLDRPETLLGRFTRHHAFLDTLTCDRGLDLIWWKGTGPAPLLNLPWMGGGSRDLTAFAEHALQFRIRKKRPTETIPVLVLGWQDETGHSASIHLNQSHVLDPALDTAWQDVSIPFSAFSRGRAATDFSRIEALHIGLEHFGEVYIDQVRVGPHLTHRKIKRKARKAPLSACPDGRFVLFEEQFDHVWGLGDHGDRRRAVVSNKRGRNKSNAIESWWDFTPPPFQKASPPVSDGTLGCSWNGWKAVTIPSDMQGSLIQFNLKNIGINPGPSGDLPLAIGIVDHLGVSHWVPVTGDRFDQLAFGHWQTCTIPLEAFSWNQDGENPSHLSSIAQIAVRMESKGHVFVDDLQITLSN